jgi:hypothetical protein
VRLRLRAACVAVLLTGLAPSCGGGGAGAHGYVGLAVTDAPFPATEGCLAAALLEVDGAEIRAVGGGFHVRAQGVADRTLAASSVSVSAGAVVTQDLERP